MNRDELIELIADAVDHSTNPTYRAIAKSRASDVLQSIDQAGFVIVPKEPTREMIAGGRANWVGFPSRDETFVGIFTGMIEASPLQEKGQ